MGAWGPGGFDNDDALDWIDDLCEADTLDVLRDTLTAVAEKEDYIQVDEGSEAVAAAEVHAWEKNIPYVAPAGKSCAGQSYTARLRVSAIVIADGLGGSTRTEYASNGPRAWTEGEDERDCLVKFEFGGYSTVTQTLLEGATVVNKVESRYHQETESEWVLTNWRSTDLAVRYSEFAAVKDKVWQQRTLTPAGTELQRTSYDYDGFGRLRAMGKPGHNNWLEAPTQAFEYVNYNSSTSSPMRVLQRQRLDVGQTPTTPALYQDSYTFAASVARVARSARLAASAQALPRTRWSDGFRSATPARA
ncbi:MAG: DUF4259 domain-containing protein [Ardenticatenales bacterium]|nr:DUF4259 domain-containing protein [Ardenticatenales bacterium]